MAVYRVYFDLDYIDRELAPEVFVIPELSLYCIDGNEFFYDNDIILRRDILEQCCEPDE